MTWCTQKKNRLPFGPLNPVTSRSQVAPMDLSVGRGTRRARSLHDEEPWHAAEATGRSDHFPSDLISGMSRISTRCPLDWGWLGYINFTFLQPEWNSIGSVFQKVDSNECWDMRNNFALDVCNTLRGFSNQTGNLRHSYIDNVPCLAMLLVTYWKLSMLNNFKDENTIINISELSYMVYITICNSLYVVIVHSP